MRLGSLDVHIVADAAFRLDGGAMFGAVPKVLWERPFPADDKNRIALATNCLCVRGAGFTAVCVFEHNPRVPWRTIVEDGDGRRRVEPFPSD
jgi:hypothetical protein